MLNFCAPCLFGVEGILGAELKRLGARDVRPENGRVLFSGDEHTLVRANLQSRYAERIQLLLGQFPARSFEELFEGVKALPLERYIGQTDRFPVKGWSLQSALHSIPDCQSIVKKAAVERLRTVYPVEWFEETGALYQIQFTIMKDTVSILLDTSGTGLHKRGYRENAVDAPLKETLAAAIADVTRARFAEQICDPCCGSGTLLIEAAWAARRIAPGLRRPFAAEHWRWISDDVWREERERAEASALTDRPLRLWGGDIDDGALRLTRENAEKAGIADCLTAEKRDLRDFVPEGDSGLVLCNPPYGERMLDIREAAELIRVMGKVFVPKPGWTYGIISPHDEFESLFGRPATKRRKLYNGMLPCTLYMYF